MAGQSRNKAGSVRLEEDWGVALARGNHIVGVRHSQPQNLQHVSGKLAGIYSLFGSLLLRVPLSIYVSDEHTLLAFCSSLSRGQKQNAGNLKGLLL